MRCHCQVGLLEPQHHFVTHKAPFHHLLYLAINCTHTPPRYQLSSHPPLFRPQA